MSTEIVIREAHTEDLELLTEINSQGDEEGLRIARERLPEFINERRLLCAIKDSEIAGLLYWKENFPEPGTWELTQVTVQAEKRGEKVGQVLVEKFLEKAKERGVARVVADIVGANPASEALLRKCGARVTHQEGEKMFYEITP